MTKHYLKHISDTYTKEQYKVDMLAHNGRMQKTCKICSQPTSIPKGEAEYPDYHKKCYTSNMLDGNKNPNWIGGKVMAACPMCGDRRESYSARYKEKTFCSYACSATYRLKNSSFKRTWDERSQRFSASRSKKEIEVFNLIVSLYPDAIHSHKLEHFSVDIYIPSKSLFIEFDGTYWHSLEKHKKRDRRKDGLVATRYPHLSLIRIPELDWDKAKDKLAYIKSIIL